MSCNCLREASRLRRHGPHAGLLRACSGCSAGRRNPVLSPATDRPGSRRRQVSADGSSGRCRENSAYRPGLAPRHENLCPVRPSPSVSAKACVGCPLRVSCSKSRRTDSFKSADGLQQDFSVPIVAPRSAIIRGLLSAAMDAILLEAPEFPVRPSCGSCLDRPGPVPVAALRPCKSALRIPASRFQSPAGPNGWR